ncbi:MAG TPA: Ser-Thr-rich GPI-anchored membrane family protein [bacterium]
MKKLMFAAPFLLSLVIAQGAFGANIYVSPTGTGTGTVGDPAGLQAALDTAKANAEADTLYLQAGTYAADTGFAYAVSGTDVTALTISGGWDAVYALQTADPSLSAIDGQQLRRALLLEGDGAGVNLTVTLANLTVRNGFTNAYAALPGDTGYGAGVYVRLLNGASVKLVVSGCELRDNKATDASSAGGGIYTTGDFELHDSVFVGNQSAYGGGAVYSGFTAPYTLATAPQIDGCLFEANLSAPPYGAHLFTTVSPLITDSTFKGRADGGSSGGAGVFATLDAHPVFERCRFVGNVADGWGGAIYLWDAPADVIGCLFTNNIAGYGPDGSGGTGAGGAIASDCPNLNTPHLTNIVNSTFVGNWTYGTTPGSGGAVYNRMEAMSIANSIFWDNGYFRVSTGYPYKGGAYALYNAGPGAGTISYSGFQGSLGSTNFADGGGNIPLGQPGPAFADADFRLPGSSPFIDAGSNAALPAGYDEDFDGSPRIFAVGDLEDRVVDIGWDEYVDGSLQVTDPAAGTAWFNDGTAPTISWTCSNVGGSVRLALWKGDLLTGSEIAEIAASVPCSDQTYAGYVPPADLADATDYAVTISSLYYPMIKGSSAPLATNHIRLTSPNGGQGLVQGSTYHITWQSGNLAGATIRIDLYNGATLARTITAAAPNTGTYSWKVPLTQAPGTTYRVKVSTTAPVAAEDLGDADIRILPAVTLTAPNGGQRIKRGTTYKITWTYKNNPGTYVRLDLFRGGVLSRNIVVRTSKGTFGKGFYFWTVPATQMTGTNYTIRVRSTAYTNCFDFSNAKFSITR